MIISLAGGQEHENWDLASFPITGGNPTGTYILFESQPASVSRHKIGKQQHHMTFGEHVDFRHTITHPQLI